MRPSTRAALGSAAFLVLAPGVVAGVVPWWLTRWEPGADWSHLLPLRALGAVAVIAGVAALLDAFARFVREGLGTPAPVAPTRSLVVGGLYRYVRNPMYLAVAAVIGGQALLLWRGILVPYLVCFLAAVVAFVRLYEEPVLRRRFGSEYDEYARAVPAWWPRRRAWRPASLSRGRE